MFGATPEKFIYIVPKRASSFDPSVMSRGNLGPILGSGDQHFFFTRSKHADEGVKSCKHESWRNVEGKPGCQCSTQEATQNEDHSRLLAVTMHRSQDDPGSVETGTSS